MTVAKSQLAARPLAVPYDGTLRYLVPSRHNVSAPPYLVELDSYHGNGMCICKDFQLRREPLLRRGVTPDAAVREKLIKLKENRAVEDALRCEHILIARSQFADDVIEAIHNAQKKQAAASQNAARAR